MTFSLFTFDFHVHDALDLHALPCIRAQSVVGMLQARTWSRPVSTPRLFADDRQGSSCIDFHLQDLSIHIERGNNRIRTWPLYRVQRVHRSLTLFALCRSHVMGAILRAIFLREAVAFDVTYLLAEPTFSVSETALAWQMCRLSTPVACFRLQMSESPFFGFATVLFMLRRRSKQ